MAFQKLSRVLPAAPRPARGNPRSGGVSGGVRHANVLLPGNFTIVSNQLAQHGQLSLLAIGTALHIQSLPEGAQVSIRALAERFPETEHRIGRALRELEAAGFLRRTRLRTPAGKVVTRTVSYNSPVSYAQPGPERPPGPGRGPGPGQEPGQDQEQYPAPASVPASAPVLAPVPVPVPAPALASASAPARAPASVPVPASVQAPASAPALASASAWVSAPAPALASASASASASVPVPVPASVQGSGPGAGPGPEPGPESAPEVSPSPGTGTESGRAPECGCTRAPEPACGPEPTAGHGSWAGPVAVLVAEPGFVPESALAVRPGPESESGPEFAPGSGPASESIPGAGGAPGAGAGRGPAPESAPGSGLPGLEAVREAPAGQVLREEAARLLAGLRIREPRLLLAERDVERLVPGVVEWLERGAAPEAVRRALTADVPYDMRNPAGLIAYRLRASLPAELPPTPWGPTGPPAPDRPLYPFQTCDDCERAFRSPTTRSRCGDCEAHKRRAV